METLVTRPLPPSTPEAVRIGHEHLPREALDLIETQLQEIVNRHLLELSLVEQYKRGELFLTDVSAALGHYPNVEKTMQWLQSHGARIGPGADMRAISRKAVNAMIEKKRGSVAGQPR